MIETLFGLARLGYTNRKGMPSPLQLALVAQEFSDVIVFSLAAAGRSACDVRRARTRGALARLSRDLPAALAHGPRAAMIGYGAR